MMISSTVSIDEKELQETFVRSSGPGGQNVNKVSTAVQLRFNVKESPSLSEGIRERLLKNLGHRLTIEGVLVIHVQTHRSQERNRLEARQRLADLIRSALIVKKKRISTKPTLASKEKHRQDKQSRGQIKKHRRPVKDFSE